MDHSANRLGRGWRVREEKTERKENICDAGAALSCGIAGCGVALSAETVSRLRCLGISTVSAVRRYSPAVWPGCGLAGDLV